MLSASAMAAPSGVTFVESPIQSDTTWTEDGGPYRLIRSVAVEPGATLTIRPGTEVQLAEGVSLTVRGSLRATGTETRPVLITQSAASGRDLRWETIRYNGSESSTLSLRNTTLRGGRSGITTTSGEGAVTITDSRLQNFSVAGLSANGTTTPPVTITRSTLTEIGGHAIRASPSIGAVEEVELDSTDRRRNRTARHTLRLAPGVGVSMETIRLRYPAERSVADIETGSLRRIGLDTDNDGDIDQSLDDAVSDVSVSGRHVEISLSHSTYVSSRDRLIVEFDGVVNPRTRGVYPVGVSLLERRIPQLSDGVHAMYVVGAETTPYAYAPPTDLTRVRGITVSDSEFEEIDGAGLFADADIATGIRVSDSRFIDVRGDGVAIRAAQSEGSFRGNSLHAGDAGIHVETRTQTTLVANENRISESETGIRVRQSERRDRGVTRVTLRGNELVDNDRNGLEIQSETSEGELWLTDNVISENGEHGVALSNWAIRNGRVTGNRVLNNGEDGVAVNSHVVRNVTLSRNRIAENGGDGLDVFVRALARDFVATNNTIVDNRGHALTVRSDLLVHRVTVAGNRLANNGGAGVLVSSPLTHSGQLTVSDNVIAANGYGLVSRGTLNATVRNNDIVFNTNTHVRPPALDGVAPGTGLYVAEGSRGAILDQSDVDAPFEELVANPQLRQQIEIATLWDDTVAVLRTDGVSHTRSTAEGAVDIRRVDDSLPTGIELSYGEADADRYRIANNDVYGHDTGMDINISRLVTANATARIVTDSIRTVNAESNYWGAASGPYHSSILPEGDGDEITITNGWVDFIPVADAPIGQRYRRPTPRLSTPSTAVAGSQIQLSGAESAAETGSVSEYHFVVNGTSHTTRERAGLSLRMPNETLTVALSVEDGLGIDSNESATARIRPVPATGSESADSTETAAALTEPEPGAASGTGLLSAWGLLGGGCFLAALFFGGYGMVRTVRSQPVPMRGLFVQLLAGFGILVWLVAGVVGSTRLVFVAGVAGILWIGLTGTAYLVATRT
ncbi:right-handed parallel beta-helix repeat-containing protein [Haloferax sulfurifontis]|nr:right-handed parallel beta-helix repeat-containing protein [Haloferax sulfurifontis]